MDLVLKHVSIAAESQRGPLDIAIEAGRIAAIEPAIAADAETLDLGGRLVVPGFVESHIHLDKACISERCAAEEGTLAEPIREVSRAKRAFTVADIYVVDRGYVDFARLYVLHQPSRSNFSVTLGRCQTRPSNSFRTSMGPIGALPIHTSTPSLPVTTVSQVVWK